MREFGFGAGGQLPDWPRRLNVLAMPPGETLAAPAPPLAALLGALRALKRYGLRSGALYFVEGARRWFSWHDPLALAREGRVLAQWCETRRIALVLLLDSGSPAAGDVHGATAPRTGAHDAFPAARAEFHGACAGVARLRRTHGELLWEVDFWRTGRALMTGALHALRFAADSGLTVAPEFVAGDARRGAQIARDEARVVVSRDVVAHQSWVPPHWEIVADNDAMPSACGAAQAATVLLAYTGRDRLEALCAAIHALRRQCGQALKIVVVERSEALRQQYELLVLGLGANLVIGRELPFSRIQSLLHSLQGQLHTRPVIADYRAALAAALSEAAPGYLPVRAFCERVRTVLDRGAVLQLSHVLVKLALLPERAHVDALRCCVPRRAGDVFTADAGYLYVFLFACRIPDADTTLARLFSVPVTQLSDRIVHLAGQGIDDELDALEDADRHARGADYSDLFPAAAAGLGPATPPTRAASLPGPAPVQPAGPGAPPAAPVRVRGASPGVMPVRLVESV
jgi:cellulose biosynthesis protein BcsE